MKIFDEKCSETKRKEGRENLWVARRKQNNGAKEFKSLEKTCIKGEREREIKDCKVE